MNVKSSPAYIDQLDKSTDEPSQIKTFSEAVKKVLYRDLNGDGKVDLVTANQGSDTASVLLGNGTGGFSASTALVTGSSPRNLAIGDINNDKLPDVVVSNGLANTLSVFTQRCQ